MQIKYQTFYDRNPMIKWVNSQSNITVINFNYEYDKTRPYVVYYFINETTKKDFK